MAIERWRPRFSRDIVAAARAYALDFVSSVFLFFCTSVMAGRVWRFPFDDEIYTLSLSERYSALKLLTEYPTVADVHPPLSYLLFYGMQQLGLSETGMRLCSLAMTALALALFHLLALTLIAQRHRRAVPLSSRIIAVLLFGLSALTVAQGDAIRWYPLFALLIALFVTLYLAGGNGAMRLCSALPLGLAASTNHLAAIVILPFVIYRYGLQRAFHASFDLAYWVVTALFAGIGLYSAYSLFVNRFALVGTQFVDSIAQAALTDVLGFFGGNTLGLSQAWIVIPAVAISAFAVFSEIDRRQPGNPVNLLLLLLVASALMVPPGFAKPRSFLYLAPVLAAVLTLFLDRQARVRNAGVAVLLAALLLAASVAAIANINAGTRPFKRNSVIPYRSIVDFIDSNGTGRVLVISTDPVIPWVLRQRHDGADRCVSHFLAARDCFASAQRYDSIFVIIGYSDKSANAAVMRKFNGAVGTVTAGRRKVATLHAGLDEDAELKSRFTGVALERDILTVDLYR